MKAFDRAHARGPWRALPAPAFLADRGAGVRFQLGWAGGLALLAAAAALAATGPTHGRLLAATSLRLVWQQSLPTLLLGLGMAVVLARGGLDLSGAAVGGLASAVAAATGSPALALLAALGCGLANGLLVALLRVPGWLVTGLTVFLVQAAVAASFGGRSQLGVGGDGFAGLLGGAGLVAGAAALAAVAWFQLAPGAARGSRLRDRLSDVVPYLFSAALAGVSGLYLVARLGVATAPRAPWLQWTELVLVAVLGGGYLGSGRASVAGAFVAALTVGALRFGLQAAGASSGTLALVEQALLVAALGGSAALHVAAARRYARRREGAPRPTPAPGDAGPRRFDRALFQGPGRLLPVPVHLIDRRWALRIEWTWCAALLVGLGGLAALAWRTDAHLLGGQALRHAGTTALVPALLALGACAVVARGGWDFSAPALAGLAASLALRGGPGTALAVALGVGLAGAALVALARVPGWLASAGLLLAVLAVRAWVAPGATAAIGAPAALGWAVPAGGVVLGVAAVLAVVWLQLAPGGDLDRPLVRWRERLADGLPYVFSSLLAGVAGVVLLAQAGRAAPPVAAGGEVLPALILAGCWLGAGRANVAGALLAIAGLTGVELLAHARGAVAGGAAASTVPPAAWAGLALLALAASRVVHVTVARAYALRERAAPDAPLTAVQEEAGP